MAEEPQRDPSRWPAGRWSTIPTRSIKPRRKPAVHLRPANFSPPGRLCALQLISGSVGYKLRGEPDKDYPRSGPVRPRQPRSAAFRTLHELFKGAASSNRRTPVHRHVAEFLGGRYLARVIQNGLPARRVISLITGEDAVVVTELRGLSAWLAAHSGDARADLIERDPIGVGLYGDIGGFTSEEKLALLESLQREGKRLGFRPGGRPAPLGALGTPDMEPVIKEVLTDSSREEDHQAFVEFTLNVLRSRDPRSGLSEVLLAIVRDETRGRARQCTGPLCILEMS